MIGRLVAPRTPKRTEKEVEAELNDARVSHAVALEAKDTVLGEFRSFERLIAQKQ